MTRILRTPDEPNGLCKLYGVRVAFQVVFTSWRGTYESTLNFDVGKQLTQLWPADGNSTLWPIGGFDFETVEDVAEGFPDGLADDALAWLCTDHRSRIMVRAWAFSVADGLTTLVCHVPLRLPATMADGWCLA